MLFRSSLLIMWVFFLKHTVHAARKISCFYNSSAYWRKGQAKFTYQDLQPAVPYCTHLVYGFVGIDENTYEVKSLDSRLDTESGLNNFRNTIMLKKLNPAIKMLLSVGGFQDASTHTYLKVLEANDSRAVFIKSLVEMVEQNGFDGVDLAWQFPTYEEKKNETILDTVVDFIQEHRTMFRCLVEELSAELTRRKRLLTLTVLPHIKADDYIVFDTIKDCVEHLHLMTYDYKTPYRYPNEADYTAPLYYVEDRNENRNVEQTVNWWIQQNVPAEKLLIAIPTFGRSWRIDRTTGRTLRPPVKAIGPGEAGADLRVAGTLAYYELCCFVTTGRVSPNSAKLQMVKNTVHHFGPYAYRRNKNKEGIWVSFDDPEAAAEKAKFTNRRHIGGVAIVDLSFDDFKGKGDLSRIPFPILRAAKDNLALYSN